MTTTKYYALSLSITQAFLEVGAHTDGKTEAIIGVFVVVVALILFTILICWCCCDYESRSDSPSGERTRLIAPRPSQETRLPDEQRLLVEHRAFLRDRMDVDFGLLEVLLGSEILSYEAFQNIKSKSPFQERNGTLLDYMLEHNFYHRLNPALEETRQSHITNFLQANGVYSQQFYGVWPLSERIVRAMDANRQSLLDLIDCTELVNGLYAKNVISCRHKEAIASKPTCYERSEILLDIIRRLSLRDYSTVMGCLHATKQSHIVQPLAEGGRIVRVHANLRGVEKVSQAEEKLVDKITYLLRNQTTSYVDYILELVHLRLIGVTLGHSVVCHFHCPTVGDLKTLTEKLQSQELEKSLKTVFNVALPERHIAGVAITSVDNQYAVRTVSRDSSVGSLKRSDSRAFYTADDIETRTLHSILEKNLPVPYRVWASRSSKKKY